MMRLRLALPTAALLALAACGPTPPPAPPPDPALPPITVTVDPTLVPPSAALPGILGGPARPLESLTDAHGTRADFVRDEVLVYTDDEAALRGGR